jgi:hypothetical protein
MYSPNIIKGNKREMRREDGARSMYGRGEMRTIQNYDRKILGKRKLWGLGHG